MPSDQSPHPPRAAAPCDPLTTRSPSDGDISRRSVLSLGLIAAAGAALAAVPAVISGCKDALPSAAQGKKNSPGPAFASDPVVLYSSVDTEVLEPMLAKFTALTGVKVAVVGDTEVTKSTGLGARLIAEASAPKADLYWSSETLSLADLAERDILSPGLAPPPNWPAPFVGKQQKWVGFGLRLRQIAYHTGKLGPNLPAAPPTCLNDLTHPRFKGKVAMARPAFGTTRGHMAWLLMHLGPRGFERWLLALKENEVRLLDGNSAVVRAIATGIADVGLTDSDDVLGGLAQSWPIAAAPAAWIPWPDDPSTAAAAAPAPPRTGTLAIPTAVGRIAGRPINPNVEILLAWLIGGDAEAALAKSDSANIPVALAFPDAGRATGSNPSAGSHTPGPIRLAGDEQFPDWHQVLFHTPAAMKMCSDILGQ